MHSVFTKGFFLSVHHCSFQFQIATGVKINKRKIVKERKKVISAYFPTKFPIRVLEEFCSHLYFWQELLCHLVYILKNSKSLWLKILLEFFKHFDSNQTFSYRHLLKFTSFHLSLNIWIQVLTPNYCWHIFSNDY